MFSFEEGFPADRAGEDLFVDPKVEEDFIEDDPRGEDLRGDRVGERVTRWT